MRGLIAVLLLGLSAWQTHTRLEAWRSDQALFLAAVQVTPRAPRPWLNLGAAQFSQGETARGLDSTLQAAALARTRGDRWLQHRVALQLRHFDVFAGPVCDRPPASSFCASD